MLTNIKKEVCQANQALKENGLVKWTSGNVSFREPETNYVVIKPSGIHFDALMPGQMVVVDLQGNVIEGEHSPSVDTASHLYVYLKRPDINSIVHTHSPFATSFAIRGISLPAYTTTAANLFGGAVPCSDYAAIGEKEIGKQIVHHIGSGSAILLRNHGVFTIGNTVENALKAAVILEEVAEYAHYATLHNDGIEPLDKEIIEQCQSFYKHHYGQAKQKN